MRAYERLLEYAVIVTDSDENGTATPSTERQHDLARRLAADMKALGISHVYADEHAYVYGDLPATAGLEDKTPVGFIAHLDTVPVPAGTPVRPALVPDYDGGELPLGDSGLVLSPSMFPHLPGLKGQTLIVTDGRTVLGTDDKAGVAEILTAAERLLGEGTPHGPIRLCFTPDEEIGHGAALLDLDRFGAKYAYTVDGGDVNEIEYETFNAASARWEIRGVSVHPGSAKDTMINAAAVAAEIVGALPREETPEHTEGYEGFYHLCDLSGDVSRAEMSFIIRDHDRAKFEARKQTMRRIEGEVNARWGAGTARLTLRDQYYNMAEKVNEHPEVLEKARAAIRDAGMEPVSHPVRGGTDGSQLSFRGLPCPNLGTGGFGFHGPYEHITAERMDKVVEVLLGIAAQYAL